MSEDKIEVGEYVRTKDGKFGIFDRYSKRNEDSLYKSPFNCFIKMQKRKTCLQCDREYIFKHSKKVKELIEAEDCLIYKLKGNDWVRKGFVRKHIDARTNKEYLSVEFYSLDQLEILQIVTREQLESVAYTV